MASKLKIQTDVESLASKRTSKIHLRQQSHTVSSKILIGQSKLIDRDQQAVFTIKNAKIPCRSKITRPEEE
jgi:hypothetical protein